MHRFVILRIEYDCNALQCIGLGENSLDHRRREEFPAIFSIWGMWMKELSVFIDENGQNELSAILNAVFSIQFSNVEFRKAEPQKYRLLQAADFICSMELLKIKRDEKRLSKSEQKFFYKSQELKKTFFKSIEKKKL